MFGVSSVSYVAVSGQVMDKVVKEAREHPDEQVVGVLLGGRAGGGILIEDAATGPAESNSTHATLTGDSIARIADDIINKRIRGSIVGWYHSHVRGGVFMSETDVETQLKLQQFSPLVTAMVIDAHTGKSGFFRADAKTKGAVPVPAQDLTTEVTQPTPAPYPTDQAMYPQAPPPAAPTPIPTRTILLVVLLITLGMTAGIIALVYYRMPGTAGNLAIEHTPPAGPFRIGNTITFDANATGTDLKNVTLAYRIIERTPAGGLVVGDLIKVPMLLKAAEKDTYSYTIPSSEISGVYVNYYISAFDASDNVVRSDVYNLSVGDFDWTLDRTDEVIVTRTIAGEVRLDLQPINGFNLPVTIRVGSPGPPAGVSIRTPSPVVPGQQAAVLRITATGDAEIVRRTEVAIEAVYSPGGAVQFIRPITLILTVTDFSFDVQPRYNEVKPDHEAPPYTLTLTVNDGFRAPNAFKLSVTGLEKLEDKISWRFELVEYKIDDQGTAKFNYNLVFNVESGAEKDLYLFTVRISAATTGGTISHDISNIQLKIIS